MNSRRCARVFSGFLVVLALALNGCATGGTDKLNSPQYSANYGESLALRQMAPPHERGIKSLALLYRPYPNARNKRDPGLGAAIRVTGQPDPFVGPFEEFGGTAYFQSEAEVVVPRGYLEERFFAEAEAAPHVTAYRLTEEEAQLANHVIDQRGFYKARSFDAAGREILSALKAKGVDALVLVDEQGHVENLGRSLPSKGVFQFIDRTWAVAGFRFALIDTATGEEVEGSAFIQASTQPVELPWWAPLHDYPPFHLVDIRDGVMALTANNVRVMLQLLKVIPGDDGAFLSYDPAELRRAPAYPQ